MTSWHWRRPWARTEHPPDRSQAGGRGFLAALQPARQPRKAHIASKPIARLSVSRYSAPTNPRAQPAWPPAATVNPFHRHQRVDGHSQQQHGHPVPGQQRQAEHQEPGGMHMQRKHQVLGIAQAAAPVDQLQPERKRRQQHEHRRAQIGHEAFADLPHHAFQRLGLDVDAPLDALAQPAGQPFAEEDAILQARPADPETEGATALLRTVDPHGARCFQAGRGADAKHQQHHDADTEIQPQRQHVMLAPAGQVLRRQLTRLQQQQLQRAPERAFGGEIGAAELLQEFAHRRRPDAHLLAAARAERRWRLSQRAVAVRAGRDGGRRRDHGVRR